MSLIDDGGPDRDMSRARPSPDADLCISREAEARVESADRSTMHRPRDAADCGRRSAGQHDPRQGFDAEHFKASIHCRR